MPSDSPWQDADRLESMYWDRQMTPYDIAEELGCTPRTIYNWLEEHDIEQRSHGHNCSLAKNNSRTPMFYTMQTGYERWESDYRGERNRVKVHRLLAVAEYGFEAVCGKDVHHKNGIRWDNRPENIEILDPSEHMRTHWEQGDMGQELVEYNINRRVDGESGQVDKSVFAVADGGNIEGDEP